MSERRVGLSTRALGRRLPATRLAAWLDAWRPPAVLVVGGVDDPDAVARVLVARDTIGVAVLATWAGALDGSLAARLADEVDRAGRARCRALALVAPEEAPAAAPADLVDALLRATHGARGRGPALLVGNDGPDGPLGPDAIDWLLADGPWIGVALDAGASFAAERASGGAPVAGWFERHGARVALVRAAGGVHPADAGVDWRMVAELAPRRAPWIFDPPATMPDDDVRDAVAFLHAARLATR